MSKKTPLKKCGSCGRDKESRYFIFGICRECQDFIIHKRANDYNKELERLGREQIMRLDEQEAKIKEMRSELEVDRAAVELVKLIRSIK